jgi:hypothetical protein
MPGAQFEPETLESLNTELEAIRELDQTTYAAIERFNKGARDATQEWDQAFKIREEDPDYDFLGNGDLLSSVQALPQVIEDRVRLGKQILNFTTNINGAISTKSDGSKVEGTINPLTGGYTGDYEDLPALFLSSNGEMLGRIVELRHSGLRHTYHSFDRLLRMGHSERPDPLTAVVWPHRTDMTGYQDEMDPEEVKFLFSSATLIGGDKNGYILPDPDEYSPPLEPAIN